MHWNESLYFVITQDTIAHIRGAVASALPEGISVPHTDSKRTLLLRKHLVKWRIFYKQEIKVFASKRKMCDSKSSILLQTETRHISGSS
jgi:hypothetical protein